MTSELPRDTQDTGPGAAPDSGSSATRPEAPTTLARQVLLTGVGMFTGPVVGVLLAMVLVVGIVDGTGSIGALGPALLLAFLSLAAGWAGAMYHCHRLGLGLPTVVAAGVLPMLLLVVAGPVLDAWQPAALLALVAPVVIALAVHGGRARRLVAAVLTVLVIAVSAFVWGPTAGGLEPDQQRILVDLDRKPFSLHGPADGDDYQWSAITADPAVEYTVTTGDERYFVHQWQDPSILGPDLEDGEIGAARGGKGGVVLRREDTWITVRAWSGPGAERRDDRAARDFALDLQERSPRWLAGHSG